MAAGDQIQSYRITKDFLVGLITEIRSWILNSETSNGGHIKFKSAHKKEYLN